MKKQTILTKFLLWILPSIIVIVLISATYLYQGQSSKQIQQIKALTNEIVFARSLETGRLLDRIFSDLEQFANRSDMQNMDFESVKNDLIAWQKKYSDLYQFFGIQYPNGDIKLTNGAFLHAKNEVYYKAIFEEGKDKFITSPFKSKSSGKMIFGIHVAIKNSQGRTLGAVIAAMPHETLLDIVNDVKLSFKGYTFITDYEGLTIAHPDLEVMLKLNILDSDQLGFKGLSEAGRNMQTSQSGHSSIYRPDGSQAELIYARIPNSPQWTIGIAIDTNDMYAGIKSLFVDILTVFLLIVAIVVVLLFVSSRRVIIKPIKEVLQSVTQISKGDLTTKFQVKNNDEIGQLKNHLNQMTEQLYGVIENVHSSAENIKEASEQVSSSSQQLSQGANEQAASTEEISSTMEQMTSNIQQNTDNAKVTAQISEDAQKGTLDAGDKAKQSTEAQNMISEKIGIINDIAFQINILALNAAVEAARAGEYGKGFAVVATEVRKLAERSKLAAEEIIALSQNTKELSDKAGESLSGVIPQIEQTANLVQEIASASIEQNSGADQVNNAIQQLNQITQQNAASSEELASTAEEMTAQAQQLKEAIAYFKLES